MANNDQLGPCTLYTPLEPSSEWLAASQYILKGRFYIIQITKHEAELIRELCPETHIRIVNAGKSSKAKNRFMSEESKALRTLGMIRGTINKEHGGHANAV